MDVEGCWDYNRCLHPKAPGDPRKWMMRLQSQGASNTEKRRRILGRGFTAPDYAEKPNSLAPFDCTNVAARM